MITLRRTLTRIDQHVLAVALIVAIATLPLLTRPGLPRHTDLELHVFRAAEFQAALADRPLDYPRWAADFYYGYGYPIFNYYAPLAYYATSAIALVPGLGIVGAMKAVLVLTFALAALGAYYLARRHFGSTAGVVASAANVLSPYLLFIDPFMRGDAAEFLALGVLPWVFLAFDRPLTSTRDLARAALALAALVFSHNLMALIGAALLAAWVLWRGLLIDGVGRWPPSPGNSLIPRDSRDGGWPRDLAAIVLAASLSAVFWLPFFVERDAVRLDVAGPGHFDFHNHFVEPGALLQPSPALDLGATTPHFVYNLGLAQWVLALPALLMFRRIRQPESRVPAFFALMALAMVFLVTPASAGAWEAVQPAALIQFPWRFLGPIALALAMCAACGVVLLPKPRWAAAIVLAALLGSALPTMYPPLWDADFGDTSPRGMIEFELSGVALGTTSTGDFLPVTVAQSPPPVQWLIDAYRAGRPVDRFDYDNAPDARVEPIHFDGMSAEYSIETPTDFTARFYVFAFPGWQAYVDGQPVSIRPSAGDGFITFDVPASASTFALRFESTPPRTAGAIVSLASALIIIALFVKPRQSKPQPNSNSNSNFLPLLVVAVFLAIKIIVFDRCDTCFRYTSPPGQALAASNAQRVNFGNHIDLLGFDLPRREVQPGQSIPLTLYWKATAPVPTNYQAFAHLTRPAFILWGQSDKLNPGDFPSTRWPLDKYVWDDHTLRVLPGTPPGEYAIVVGLYTLDDGRRAPVFDSTGKMIGDSVQLTLPVTVQRASAPPASEALNMQTRLDVRAGEVTLLGASIEQRSLPRPNFARLTLFWQAASDAPEDITLHVRLAGSGENAAQEIVASPGGGLYPTSEWRAGEIVRDVYAVWLPPNFAPGVYTWQVSIEDTPGRIGPGVYAGQIEVLE